MGNTISYTTKEHELDLGEKGVIKGLQYDEKSCRYAGVPYALPPTGEHRWRKPRPLPASHKFSGPDGTPFDATKFRAVCPQEAFHVRAEQADDLRFTEDCLIMNIWTPVEKPGHDRSKKWPVLLWLHGGWFQMGDPSQDATMDPTEMISTGGMNAIVIAIGYRLNVFGFLGGKELEDESSGDSSGNFGLWDQRLAMEWVKENIGAFGGDPDNITLGGRSAGSYGVEAQVLHDFRAEKPYPGGQLFHRFYMISNAIPAQPKTLAEVQPQFDELCAHFQIPVTCSGAEKLAKLRNVSWKDLLAAIKQLENHTFRPITDEAIIKSGMVEYKKGGQFAAEFKKRGMRMLIGEVSEEHTLYASYNAPQEGNIESLRLQIGNYYAPATTDRIIQHYTLPTTDDASAWQEIFGRIIADGQVLAPSRGLAQDLFKHDVPLQDIWRYRVAKRLSFITDSVAPISFGVSHAADKPWWK
jgi:carboxylesterase type B